MLYLIATPIGNLSDITVRALEVLRSCDYILCEDTRHSRRLLGHYDIATPLKSFHKFNEAGSEDAVIADIRGGVDVALISDAGTPTIADPGFRLVRRCHEEGISLSSLPGPCAAIVAIAAAGFDTAIFQFIGFLPKKAGALKEALFEALTYRGTTVCYESPKRLLSTLDIFTSLAPQRMIAVCREMTKAFEEVRRGTAPELVAHYADTGVKGEISIVIPSPSLPDHTTWDALPIAEHLQRVQELFSLSEKNAIPVVAQLRSIQKRLVYNAIHRDRDAI